MENRLVVNFFTCIVLRQYAMYFFSCSQYMAHRGIMVHEVDDGSKKFTHICLYVIWTIIQLRIVVIQIGSNDSVKIAFFIGFIKILQSGCEQSECAADKDTFCVHGFQLSGGVNHTVTGGNHIIYDDDIFTIDIISEKLMCNNRIFSIYCNRLILH